MSNEEYASRAPQCYGGEGKKKCGVSLSSHALRVRMAQGKPYNGAR